MSTLEACPDDLVARALDTPLGPAERTVLTAHLGRCPTCRAAAEVGEALREEPIALPGDELLIARLAGRAAGRGHGGTRKRRALAAAAILLLTAGTAFAGWWTTRRAPRPAPVQARTATSPAKVPPSPVARPSSPSAPEVPPANETGDAPAGVTARPHRATAASADTEGVLQEARRARASGDGARALNLYRRVTRSGRGTPAAAVAEIAIGLLLLDPGSRNDPRGALGAFDRYLTNAPEGALREEALAGRARALEALEQREAALAGWTQLVEEYPRSLLAPLARRRMAALRARNQPAVSP